MYKRQAIVYASVHHGNTKKIIDEIAKTNDVELIDATQTVEKDLSEYDLIGFASVSYTHLDVYKRQDF